jgi:hypothetical protein
MGATVGFGEEAGTAFVVTSTSALKRVGFAMEPAGVRATEKVLISSTTASRIADVTYLVDHTRH